MDNRTVLTFSEVVVLLVVIISCLWERFYIRFLIRQWLPNIDDKDPLHNDIVSSATRVNVTLSSVLTSISSIGHLVGLILANACSFSGIQIWLSYVSALIFITAGMYTVFVLPTIPHNEFTQKRILRWKLPWGLPLSYQDIAWIIIISANIWLIILTWLLWHRLIPLCMSVICQTGVSYI